MKKLLLLSTTLLICSTNALADNKNDTPKTDPITAFYYLEYNKIKGLNVSDLNAINKYTEYQSLKSLAESASSFQEKTDPNPIEVENASDLTHQERNKIVDVATSMLKTKYIYGGASKTGVDCSGLVAYVFNKIGFSLNGRTARDIAKEGIKITKEKVIQGQIMAGDLLFFNTTGKPHSHVGIAIDENTFIHASTSQRKVVIAKINSSYFKNKLEFAKRF